MYQTYSLCFLVSKLPLCGTLVVTSPKDESAVKNECTLRSLSVSCKRKDPCGPGHQSLLGDKCRQMALWERGESRWTEGAVGTFFHFPSLLSYCPRGQLGLWWDIGTASGDVLGCIVPLGSQEYLKFPTCCPVGGGSEASCVRNCSSMFPDIW